VSNPPQSPVLPRPETLLDGWAVMSVPLLPATVVVVLLSGRLVRASLLVHSILLHSILVQRFWRARPGPSGPAGVHPGMVRPGMARPRHDWVPAWPGPGED
jgi:hypothetical protein